MNLKLVLQLSLFGLIMAFATISLIPQNIEWVFWLVIFVFCAYVIAKAGKGKYFLPGFLLSVFNSVWVTAAHVLWYTSYAAHHPQMAAMGNSMGYFSTHPRMLTLLIGIPSAILFGLIMGLFAFIASKMVKPGTPPPKAV